MIRAATVAFVASTALAAVLAPAATARPAPPRPDLGANASLHGRRLLPKDNVWNRRVDTARVDRRSRKLIRSIRGNLHMDFGANWDGGPFGIPYVVVSGDQARVPVSFAYAAESDRGPYPIPAGAPIEGGADSDGDRHVIVFDRDRWKLYELYDGRPRQGGTSWTAGSGAVFNLRSNRLDPRHWTSADAAGLPILPGLVRYDEIRAGRINHALRFTVAQTRRAFVFPARHWASSRTSASLPPMGMRVRLKKTYPITGYPRQARIILTAMKRYGMIVADNGSNWYVSGAPDPRWNDDALNTLKRVPGSAFEVVTMGPITTR